MREHIMRILGKLNTGVVWMSVLFVLPNCSFSVTVGPSDNLYKGPEPRESAIFCDIEKVLGRHCATSLDKASGIRLSEAAIALAEGRTSMIGLDDSAEALSRCGGEPEAVLFEGPFPQGMPVCMNCTDVPFPTATVDQACELACYDLFGPVDGLGNKIPENPPDPSVVQFCSGLAPDGTLVSRPRARASVNHSSYTCFGGACSGDGVLNPLFEDPRRLPLAVDWTERLGVTVAGLDLVRTTPFTANFDAGAASVQHITRGDGFVEFTSGRNDQAQALGLTEIGGCGSPCPDPDPSLANMGFGIILNFDGRIYIVVRGGILLTGPQVNGSFGTYTAGQRFRVKARDNGNGTATMSFVRVDASCAPGTPCPQTTLYTHAGPANYPLRVDASIRDPGASLVDARLVYVH